MPLTPHVTAAITDRRPLVALESTLIAHGLPWPTNLETARAAEAAVREQGAVPATIAVLEGQVRIGLSPAELEALAKNKEVLKASRRDLGLVVAQGQTAATTVAATMFLAHRAGIRFFATGGIGGVHRGFPESLDISADLLELSRTPVAVVCCGAKSILDLPKTMELLEALAVPVVGYRCTEFPAFYSASSGLPLAWSCASAAELATAATEHWNLGGGGILIVQPPPAAIALPGEQIEQWLGEVEAEARLAGITGPAVTPFLLKGLAELSDGRTLQVNQELIVANARLAAEIATAWTPAA